MNFKDQWAEDEEGKRFIFTVEMQRELSRRGLPVEPASLSKLSGRFEPVIVDDDSGGDDYDYDDDDDDDDDYSGGSSSSGEQEEFEGPITIQIDPESGKYLGRMKWFNPSRGYGFIMRGGGEDIFFHRSEVLVDPATLAEGQWVLYDVEESNKGLEANEVEPYSGDLKD